MQIGIRELLESCGDSQRVRKLHADGNGSSYTYTDSGNLATRTWARGVATTYAYDGWNSLTNTAYSDGTPSVSVAYDAMGRQTRAEDATGTTTFAYDAAGSPASDVRIPLSAAARGLSPLNSETGSKSMSAEAHGDD